PASADRRIFTRAGPLFTASTTASAATAFALADHAVAFGLCRAGIAEGAAVTTAHGADRIELHGAADFRRPLRRALAAALAAMDDTIAVRPRQAGIREGFTLTATLAADRGVFAGTHLRRP